MNRDQNENSPSQSIPENVHGSGSASSQPAEAGQASTFDPKGGDAKSHWARVTTSSAAIEPEQGEQSERESFSPFDEHDNTSSSRSIRKAPLKDSRKRRLISGAVLLLATFGGLVAVYYTLKPSNSVRVSVSTKRDKRAPDATARPDKGPEDVTADAIAEVRSAMSNTPAATPTPGGASVLPRDAQLPPTSSTILPSDAASTPDIVDTKSQGSTAAVASRRNQERSIRFPDETDQSTAHANSGPSNAAGRSDSSQPGAASSVPISSKGPTAKPSLAAHTLPSLGSILPVRTLGKIYTLRSGSSIRLELTRYVQGDGWSLSKGTVLIGQIRGSEQDRAFIAVTGFIDPTQERLVNLSGDVLGDDGGSGIRGKFHKLSSGWSRAFARVGAAAVNVVGAVAGSRISGQPVIISDIGSQAISPFNREVDTTLLQQARGFVEVPAGTSGFVMVTRLPASENGADPKPESRTPPSEGTLSSASTTELTEDELAALLTSGDPEMIKAALPRMSPQMRTIAETVLTETADKGTPKE